MEQLRWLEQFAGGAIAAEAVAHSPADGYTLLLATLPQIVIVPRITKTQYDPVKDFAPITLIAAIPFILIVHRSIPAATLSEFIDYVRERPGKLAYASAGPGSLIHLAMALLLKRAGLEMNHVSYKGSVPAMTDVVAGHVPACFAAVSDAMAQASGGSVRMLAISGSRRIPQISNVPTLGESGFPGLTMTAWNGLMAPAGTPTAVIEKIAAQVILALREPKIVERLARYGADPIGSNPEEFATTIARCGLKQWQPPASNNRLDHEIRIGTPNSYRRRRSSGTCSRAGTRPARIGGPSL
jgi:tripartite-type tricarboxylate transporter receptor subunit TctC